ncbi:hypothetical protein ZHAS_00008263 [Anopheles sinensis]|uniref:Uncharacterized protein n=1 Tax=Anopheles sinensis TaxID=74873 RepID=A0A084VRQ4_ANOSI|nr:hypothetical protein ZHAS_00008263 [Anopheles sinensis]
MKDRVLTGLEPVPPGKGGFEGGRDRKRAFVNRGNNIPAAGGHSTPVVAIAGLGGFTLLVSELAIGFRSVDWIERGAGGEQGKGASSM